MTNWTVTSGSATLATDTTVGFTGVSSPKSSTKVTCTGTGTIVLTYIPQLSVKAPNGASWGLEVTGSAAHLVTGTFSVFNAGGTQTNTSTDATTLFTGGLWRPLSGATGSNVVTGSGPTAFGVLSLSLPMTSGDILWIDAVGVVSSLAQVLVDWLNPAFGNAAIAGADFADLTGRVKYDTGVSITRGRQDNINDVQAGSATFVLQNDDGWFTPNCSNSPWYVLPSATPLITLGRRCQVNMTDETGKWWTRFDGPVSEIDYTLDNTGNTNVASFNIADALAFMNRQNELSCWTKEQILNEPTLLYHWALDDAGSSGANSTAPGLAAETSGNGGSPLQLKQNATNTFTWASGVGGVETMANAPTVPGPGNLLGLGPAASPLAMPNFLPTCTTQSGHNQFKGTAGSFLTTRIPPMQSNVTGVNFSIECWFFMGSCTVSGTQQFLQTEKNSNLGPFTVLALGESKTGFNITAGLLTQASGDFKFVTQGWNQPPSFVGTAWGGVPTQLWAVTDSAFSSDEFGKPHHLVITFTGASGGATLETWIDGVSIGTNVLSPRRAYDWITVGSAYGGLGGWAGGISCLNIYTSKLTSTDINLHYNMGLTAMFGSTADNAIALLADYANMPSYWMNLAAASTGLTPVDYLDITGSNALTAMQTYEAAEKGLIYVNNLGQITFHTRDWRSGYAAPDLTLPSESYDADLGFIVSDQFLINEAGVSSALFGTGYFSENIQSDQLYGDYANGTAQSPTSFPLLTYSPGYGVRGLGQVAYFTAPYMVDLADWNVNTAGAPYLKCSQVTVDLLSNEKSGVNAIHISQLYALDIDNVITLGTPPGSMPTDTGVLDYFIEGISETVTNTSRNIVINTSPANLQRAWRPGDATYGVLGSTARIGISSMDTHAVGSLSKTHGFDPGPPYFPPTIATTMNNPSANGHGFLGENDFRGINDLMATKLAPPMCIVGQRNQAQSVASLSTFTPLIWDYVYVDTQGGMGYEPGWENWYVVTVPGYYDIDVSVVWTIDNVGNGLRRARLVLAQNAVQGLNAGTSSPVTVGESWLLDSEVRAMSTGNNEVCQLSTRTYLGLGDMVSVDLWQNAGTPYTTGTDYNGSLMSLVWVGYSTSNDQIPGNVS